MRVAWCVRGVVRGACNAWCVRSACVVGGACVRGAVVCGRCVRDAVVVLAWCGAVVVA